MKSDKPHSAEYFGEARDFWWNADFLALMGQRWNLNAIETLLDVGCGMGHWTRSLLPHLPSSCQLTGIDREPAWVGESRKRAESGAARERISVLQGCAENLPFADASFDMVTCQTLLIHVPEPERVLTEMLRVLKPGGLIVVAEPNNLASELVLSSARSDAQVNHIVDIVRLHLLCERGKKALGLGYNSLGDNLPFLFSRIGVSQIQVHLSDKATPCLPPYARPEERAFLEQALEWQQREFWIWEREETFRYFLAGGGNQDEFDSLWAATRREARAFRKSVQESTFHSAGGHVFYLVWGRKPHSPRGHGS